MSEIQRRWGLGDKEVDTDQAAKTWAAYEETERAARVPPALKTEFEVGDAVTLKGERREMTVIFADDDACEGTCTFTTDRGVFQATFPFGALRDAG
jgi:hypothetical protein